MCRPLYLSSLFLLMFSAGFVVADDSLCPNPNCNCNTPGMMTCVGVEISSFPEAPTNVDQFVFRDCLLGVVESVPYVNAVTLMIHNCAVSQINNGAFSNLSLLETLVISNNGHLTNLSEDAFVGLKSLTRLELYDNKLTRLPDGLFEGMPRLQLLDLSKNSVILSPELFQGVSSQLSHLTCDECNLNSLPIAGLDQLTGLTELDINQNNFSVIPGGAFQTTPGLHLLSLDQCGITAISAIAFVYLKELEVLELGSNRLYTLEKKIFNPFRSSLKKLSLVHNMFSTLPDDLVNWRDLREVTLGYNPWNCDCNMVWVRNLSQVQDSQDIICTAPDEVKGTKLITMEPSQYCKQSVTSLGRRGALVVCGVLLPLLIVTIAAILYCMYRAARRGKQIQQRSNAFKYSHVYGETVESTSKTSLTT